VPDLMAMAERELGAFIAVVTESFGRDQAMISAEDWIEELLLTDSLPSTTRDWRRVTVASSTRLASRMNASTNQISTS
jgi:hypothetical protein